MRRFEASADQKFWQVELTGTEALVEWGKIGGAGKQRQHKKFASEAVAKTEIAKLVTKKEAEGFVEVGKTAAPTPTPTPTPAPAPTPTPTPARSPSPAPSPAPSQTGAIAPRIVWTDALRASAKSERGDAILNLSAGKKAWLKDIAAHFNAPLEGTNRKGAFKGQYKDRFTRGLHSSQVTAVARAWAERMLASYAMGTEPKDLDPQADAAVLLEAPFEPLVSYLLERGGVHHLAKMLLAAADISYTWDDDAHYFVESKTTNIYGGSPAYKLASVLRHELASAPEAEREKATKTLEGAYATARFDLRLALARALGRADWTHAATEEFLATKKNEHGYYVPAQLFLELRDPSLVTRLAKRYPRDVPVALLLEDMGLDATDAAIAHHDSSPDIDSWTSELAAIESVPAAKQLAQSLPKKRSADIAKDYFMRRPDLAVAALEPIIKHDLKLAPFAKPLLEAVYRANPSLRGAGASGASGASAASKAKPASAADVPKVLAQAPVLRKPVTLPGWAQNLPPLLVKEGRALPDEAVRNFLLVLHQSPIGAPHEALAEVKRACDPKSLAELSWALFEGWLGAGGSSKEGWGFWAVGHLGDDDCARRLAPLVRAWPGESQHARAVVGLDVLGAIGTDVALMHLHGIAQKVKFKGLQEKARAKMDALAKARGLTAEELADRLVPDLGLDESGSLSLDFGSRTFTVGFDEELKPFVLDASGTRLGDLPKPKQTDDAEKAKDATERYKTLKKDARTVASTQIVRLEIAMCSQRRWAANDFQAFIVDHPLVVHLARRLVWGFDKTTFRVAEDRTFVSADDKTVTIPKEASVGLMHRLDLDDKTLAAWGDHFGRYELLQPFDQLGRALYAIEDNEKKSAALERIKGMKVKTGKVLGLEVRGWRKGPPQDAGWVWEMNKTVGGYELTLPLGGGLCMGWHEGTPSEQELGAVGIGGKDGKKATFGMLSPVIFSEIVRELQMLRDE